MVKGRIGRAEWYLGLWAEELCLYPLAILGKDVNLCPNPIRVRGVRTRGPGLDRNSKIPSSRLGRAATREHGCEVTGTKCRDQVVGAASTRARFLGGADLCVT